LNNLLSVSLFFNFLILNVIDLNINNQDISFIFLTFSLLIIAVLYAFHLKQSKQYIYGIFAQRYANQYLREENVFTFRINILFYILLIINVSLFIWGVNPHFENTYSTIFVVFFFVSVYYLVKYILIKFLGVLLQMKQISRLALFFTTLFDKVFALFIFPLLVMLHFSNFNFADSMEILIFLFLLLFFVLKLFWLWKIGINSFGLSRFYLFIYICTLEFFPLLLLYRGIVFA